VDWYSLPPEKTLLIRCAHCGLDTIISVEALAARLEEAHLRRYGYEKKSLGTERVYVAFIVGLLVGGAGSLLLLLLQ
jgi:hypothetical protein